MQPTTKVEVRSDERQAMTFSVLRRPIRHLAPGTVSCDRISLQCGAMRRKIVFNTQAIWGMSV
jgi:hypothetical protein